MVVATAAEAEAEAEAAEAAAEAAASSASGVALCKDCACYCAGRHTHGERLNRQNDASISQSNLELEMQQLADLSVEDFLQLHGRRWHERLVQLHHTDAGTFSRAPRPLPHTCPSRRRLQRTRSIASGHSALLGEHQGDLSADGHLTIAPTPAMLDALLGPSPFPPSAESPGLCSPNAMPGATTEARSQPHQGGPCGPTVVRRSHGCELLS